MHELALMESLVATIRDHVGERRVALVRLEIGGLTAVVPDALRFSFDVCARGTSVEGAALEIREVAGRGLCNACGHELALEGAVALCRCGSADVEITAGNELRIINVEVA